MFKKGLRWGANERSQQSHNLYEKCEYSVLFGQATGRNLLGKFLTSNWDSTTYRTDGIRWKDIVKEIIWCMIYQRIVNCVHSIIQS